MRVELENIEVMCVTVGGVSEAWGATTASLESRLPTMKRRKLYGVRFDPESDSRACVALRDDDEPDSLKLKTWKIPGGAYERRKIENAPELIAGAFHLRDAPEHRVLSQ